jgi:hypothetical protein
MEPRHNTVPSRYKAGFPGFLPAIGLLSVYLPVALWPANAGTFSATLYLGHRNAALWFLAVSGYAFLIALGLGFHRGLQLSRPEDEVLHRDILSKTRRMLITHCVVIMVLSFGSQSGWTWRSGTFEALLRVAMLQGGACFIVVGAFHQGWRFVLRRMQRICWVVLSLGGFVLLTLVLQLRMLSARAVSEALGMTLISLPGIFVVAMSIWVWGVSPLKPGARHGH